MFISETRRLDTGHKTGGPFGEAYITSYCNIQGILPRLPSPFVHGGVKETRPLMDFAKAIYNYNTRSQYRYKYFLILFTI